MNSVVRTQTVRLLGGVSTPSYPVAILGILKHIRRTTHVPSDGAWSFRQLMCFRIRGVIQAGPGTVLKTDGLGNRLEFDSTISPPLINICMDYSTIAYAKLNLDYDRAAFIKEYDEFILPNTKQICNGTLIIDKTASLNSIWKMVPDSIYKNIVAGDFDAEGNYTMYHEGRTQTWLMEQLMYVNSEGIPDAVLKGSANGYGGGTTLRNNAYHKEWFVKPQYENLEIVKFIKNLPFKKIIFMHCVSLEAGQFAGIHRDAKGSAAGNFTNLDNDLSKKGFVVLTLNISDGGVPLYWSLDGQDRYDPKFANDPAYIISDYFLHGVPVTTSRRRQIRVTGIPDDDFAELLDMQNSVLIDSAYQYAHDLISA